MIGDTTTPKVIMNPPSPIPCIVLRSSANIQNTMDTKNTLPTRKPATISPHSHRRCQANPSKNAVPMENLMAMNSNGSKYLIPCLLKNHPIAAISMTINISTLFRHSSDISGTLTPYQLSCKRLVVRLH